MKPLDSRSFYIGLAIGNLTAQLAGSRVVQRRVYGVIDALRGQSRPPATPIRPIQLSEDQEREMGTRNAELEQVAELIRAQHPELARHLLGLRFDRPYSVTKAPTVNDLAQVS